MSADEPLPKSGHIRRTKLELGRKLGLSRSHAQVSPSQARAPATAAGGSSSAITAVITPAKTGWSVLKRILETVRDASDLCPPLKASLVGVIELMNLVDRIQDAHSDFEEVARRIQQLQRIFEHYQAIDSSMSSTVTQRMEGISHALDLVKCTIDVKTGRGIGRRILESSDDVGAVVKAFRCVAVLVENFNVDTLMQLEIHALNIRRRVEDMVRDNVLNELRHVRNADYSSQDQEGCMRNTRVFLLGELFTWSVDWSAPAIFWLSGMAGTGKSTIAWSFCEFLASNGLLGGSFFCSRTSSTERSDARRIFPTLARQLARVSADYESALLDFLRSDPDVAQKSIKLQSRSLLRNLLKVLPNRGGLQTVFVIDALDDCLEEDDTEAFLDELIALVTSTTPSIKIFISSRPEPYIRRRFEARDTNVHRVTRLHDVDRESVSADIEAYISHRLSYIRQSQALAVFPPEWPTLSDVWTLARTADKLFIYAVTAVEYIKQDPVQRLQTLLSRSAGRPLTKGIDAIYLSVLSEATNPERYEPHEIDVVKLVLSTIPALEAALALTSLGDLLDMPAHRVRMALNWLHAVVYVPPDDDGEAVSIFHSSFSDFIRDRDRAPASLFVEPERVHEILAQACFRILRCNLLHFNITHCVSSYLPTVDQHLATIRPSVLYACLNWATHLVSASRRAIRTLLPTMEAMLNEKFLFWVEALYGSGNSVKAAEIIWTALSMLEVREALTPTAAATLREAFYFLQSEDETIEYSLPHLYISALPSADPTSFIAKRIWPLFPSLPCVRPKGMLAWRRDDQSLPATLSLDVLYQAGHASAVQAVLFTPDGSHIVSGSFDKTLRVWNARNGAQTMRMPLNIKLTLGDRVSSVALSPDGRLIYSGSWDRTIHVWDTHAGEPAMQPFQGHRGPVLSIVTSADGSRIVSGSQDKTLRVWDAKRGTDLLGPLIGHTNAVCSVSVSSDGKMIASGSLDASIRIWNMQTGGLKRVITTPDMGQVYSVAFSPDSMRIACASFDDFDSVRLWDVHTGAQGMLPLSEDAGPSYCVAFSPDGKYIAAGFQDQSIRIWNSDDGDDLCPPLEGHRGPICALAFSPCGKRIVSGSFDEAVRVWEVEPLDEFQGEHSPIPQPVLAPNEDGWIEGPNGELLFHIRDEFAAQNLHLSLPISRCSLLISLQGLQIDFTGCIIDRTAWTGCYAATKTLDLVS
ncbi:hypothetical protein PENSPDRAFT_693838 [Peniophora sp. CONT]|nr:hypothetical protein PENSPDRAFT_693838 [Peniophora sp. CONT]